MTAQRYGYIRGRPACRAIPTVEPSIDSLVRDYLGAVPPVAVAPQPGDPAMPAAAGSGAQRSRDDD